VVDRVSEPSANRPYVDENGILTSQSRTFLRSIWVQALIIGTGSPDGVVTAEEGSTYQDSAGTAGAIRYAKMVDNIGGDKSMGWVLI